MSTNHIYLIYMYKLNLGLNNLQWLICHRTKSNQTFLHESGFCICITKHVRYFLLRLMEVFEIFLCHFVTHFKETISKIK